MRFRHFFGKGPPYSENIAKLFYHPYMTNYTPIDSPCRVKSKFVVIKFFELISCQKNPKNSVKIRLFIGRYK